MVVCLKNKHWMPNNIELITEKKTNPKPIQLKSGIINAHFEGLFGFPFLSF